MKAQKYHLTITSPSGEVWADADVTPARGKALFNAYRNVGKYLIDYGFNPDTKELAWVTMEMTE